MTQAKDVPSKIKKMSGEGATPITELNLIGHSNATMTGLSGTVNGQKTRFSLNEILALSQGSSSGDRRMKRKISVNPK